jgi:hypothetical protein
MLRTKSNGIMDNYIQHDNMLILCINIYNTFIECFQCFNSCELCILTYGPILYFVWRGMYSFGKTTKIHIVRMPRSLNVKDNWQQTLQTTVTSKRMVVSLPLQGIISITLILIFNCNHSINRLFLKYTNISCLWIQSNCIVMKSCFHIKKG